MAREEEETTEKEEETTEKESEESVFESDETIEDVEIIKIKTTRFMDSLYFGLLSLGTIIVVLIMVQGFKDTLFSDMTDMFVSSGWNPINVLLIYMILYKLWTFIMFFSISLIVNIILAKVLNLQLGRVIILTILCYLIAVIGFHGINYAIIRYTDPLALSDVDLADFLIILLEDVNDLTFDIESIEGSSITEIFAGLFTSENQTLFDALFKIIYYFLFLQDPSLINYFSLYLIGGGNSTLWIPFQYDFLIIVGVYAILFILFYPLFVDSCSCIPPSYQTELQLAKEEEVETISEVEVEEEEKETI